MEQVFSAVAAWQEAERVVRQNGGSAAVRQLRGITRHVRHWYCGAFHRLSWPMHKTQTCMVCGRTYPAAYE